MNVPIDHVPLQQKDFRGLYARGKSDSTPDSFFLDCLNIKFSDSDVITRDGIVDNTVTGKVIVRKALYKRLNETPRFIYLDNAGNLYDSLFPNNPIYSDASFVDFSLVSASNRAYITPHNRVTGITGKSILVYEGSGTARLAGGSAPSGFTLDAVNSVDAGSVEEGYHLIAVAYLTSSGFITAPGPEIFAIVNSPGGFKVDISNLPIGPANTVGRVILATKAIPVDLYTGNQFGYELFFVAGAIIEDNTSTTTTIDFFDADLIDSADYLLDNLATVPAGVAISTFAGRLVVVGEQANQWTARLSNVGDFETFDGTSGFLTVDPSAASSGLKNAAEFRNNLVLFTSERIYSAADNGSDPSTWSITEVDKSAGTECFGINTVLDARGTNNDRLFVADRSGLVAFEGFARRPELSFNIEDIWKRINKAKFNLVHVVDDPINHRLYVAVPLDSSTIISHILLGDYSKAFTVYGTLDERQIKWAYWQFQDDLVCITGDVDATNFAPVLHVTLADGTIYDVKDGVTNDNGTAIDSWFQTALKTANSGWINHFAGYKFRVSGTGSLQITLYGEDNSNPVTLNSITLSSAPGLEPEGLMNYTNERLSLKIRVTNINEKFTFTRLDVYAKPLWLRRPA